MSNVLEFSFNTKPKPKYIVNARNNYGAYTQQFEDLKQTRAEREEEKRQEEASKPTPLALLLRLGLIASALNPLPSTAPTYPYHQEYVSTLPYNYMQNVVDESRDRRYVTGNSKPLITYKGEKKVTFF